METGLFRLNDFLKGLWMNALQESGEGRNAGHSTLGEPMSETEMEMEMIAVNAVQEVGIYADQEGAIWISQTNGREEADLICIFPEHVGAVIDALTAAKAEALASKSKRGGHDA